jgi:hypothetical protein
VRVVVGAEHEEGTPYVLALVLARFALNLEGKLEK